MNWWGAEFRDGDFRYPQRIRQSEITEGQRKRALRILKLAIDQADQDRLNLILNYLEKFPVGRPLGDFLVRFSDRPESHDMWLSRRLTFLRYSQLYRDPNTSLGEYWAYKFGYFERRLIRRPPSRKYLNYIFLLGNWLREERDLPREYVRSIIRIFLQIYRRHSASIRKEIIRAVGKVLRSPPRNASLQMLNALRILLDKGLAEDHWEIRLFSAAALLRTNSRRALEFVRETLNQPLDSYPYEAVFELLELIKRANHPGIKSILLRVYDRQVQSQVNDKGQYPWRPQFIWLAQAVAYQKSTISFPALLYYLENERTEEFEKSRILRSILQNHDLLSFQQVQQLARSRSGWSRSLAALLIGQRRRPSEIPVLSRLIKDKVIITREYALRAANKIKTKGVHSFLGEIKSSRIEYFFRSGEKNKILRRIQLESWFVGKSPREIRAKIQELRRAGDSDRLKSIFYVIRNNPGINLNSFSSLFRLRQAWFSQTFTHVYLTQCPRPHPRLIFWMLRHRDAAVRLPAAIFLLSATREVPGSGTQKKS